MHNAYNPIIIDSGIMNKDHIALVKHTGNYLAAVIATKALSFISIPVLTSLLTVEDYGITNVFLSTAQVCAILLTLNTEIAISRYYYDAKGEEDFKRFVGTSTRLSAAIFIILSSFVLLFRNSLASYFGLDRRLVLCIIPYALYTFTDNVFQQIYQPQLKSRKIAIVSSVSAYLGFLMSVAFILLMKDEKYFGYVQGMILAQMFVGVYMLSQIFKYTKICFDVRYIKYILSFALPYLPYSLSSIIVAQFGKMILGQESGFNSAGLYSFAQNLSGLMLVVIMVVHSAWNPYHMRYMNEKNYARIDGDYDIIWKGTLFFGAALSLFGYEIGAILARPQYLSALSLVPILVLGYIFYQWSFVYLRNASYVKKTIWNAVAVISGGVINVILNSLLIGRYQLLGVALSFAVSYAVLLFIAWAANKFVLKAYVPSVKSFVGPFLLFLPITALSLYFGKYEGVSFVVVCGKLGVLLIFALFIFYKYYKNRLWDFLKQSSK